MPTFTFRGPDEFFQCQLEGQRCSGTTKAGERCRRRTVKALPTCYQHSRSKYGVKIAPSGIPGAGSGLFAVRPFKKDENIVPYIGQVVSGEELDERYGDLTGPYALGIDNYRAVDSACRRGLGAWANHQPVAQSNARFVISSRGPNPTVWVRATKNIPVGREVFLNYGRDFRMGEPGVSFRTKPYN